MIRDRIIKGDALGLGFGAGVGSDALCVGAQKRALWVGAALGAAVGAASSLIGGVQASKAARRAEKRQRAQEAEEDAWYTRRYNEDYGDTAAGQHLLTRAKEFAQKYAARVSGQNAVTGGTDAAGAIAKEQGVKMVGDTIANIAATDQGRKAQVDSAHRAARQQFAQMDMAREQQRAANITNAAQNASNAIMQAGASIDAASQASGGATRLTGGSNDSVAWDGLRQIADEDAAVQRAKVNAELHGSAPWAGW